MGRAWPLCLNSLGKSCTNSLKPLSLRRTDSVLARSSSCDEQPCRLLRQQDDDSPGTEKVERVSILTITAFCICALLKLLSWPCLIRNCCFTPRHAHLSGVRRGLWNSTFGRCTTALRATSFSACVQVVGPDPGFKHLAGPVSPS